MTIFFFAFRDSNNSIQHTGLLGTALSAHALVPMPLTPWEVSCTSLLTSFRSVAIHGET
uniref:Uncharacterized protein n=1 Tax=Arundo donax TaxID=35708 RepID=A0A0A9BLU0_ARUDO